MADEVIIVEEEAVTLGNSTPVSTGEYQTSGANGVTKQGWEGKYVNYKFQNIHRVGEDAYYSSGMFRGTNDIDATGDANEGVTCVRPRSTEMQFIDRDNNSGPTHDFPRYIRSLYVPIYSKPIPVEIETESGTKAEDDDFKKWLKRADGKSSYNAQNKYACAQVRVHDIVFQIMDKSALGKVRRYVRGVTSCNLSTAWFKTNEDNEIEDVSFFDGYGYDGVNKTKVYMRRYWFENDTSYTQRLVADYNDSDWQYLEYAPAEDSGQKIVITGVFCVNDYVNNYEPTTNHVPSNPTCKPVLWKYADYHSENNEHKWMSSRNRNSVLVVHTPSGGYRGANGASGSILEIPTNQDGNSLNDPLYLEVKGVESSITDLERSRAELHDLMSDTGVNITVSNQAQSADSKRYDFHASATALNESVEILKELDDWAFPMYERFENTGKKYGLGYPAEFYPKEELSTTEAIDLVEALAGKEKNATAEILLESVVLDKIGNLIDDDDHDAIKEDFKTVFRGRDSSDIPPVGGEE